jgi:hypothetical protein
VYDNDQTYVPISRDPREIGSLGVLRRCPICGDRASRAKEYREHLVLDHPDDGPRVLRERRFWGAAFGASIGLLLTSPPVGGAALVVLFFGRAMRGRQP